MIVPRAAQDARAKKNLTNCGARTRPAPSFMLAANAAAHTAVQAVVINSLPVLNRTAMPAV
jgi:hypothetical protein